MAIAKVNQGGNKSKNACGLSFRIFKTSGRSSQNSTHRNLLRPSIHLTWKIQVQMPDHVLPCVAKSFRGSQPTSYLYKSRLHFKEMVLPLDPGALDVQNPKRSSTTEASRASMRRHNLSMNRGLVLQICASLLIISQLTLQGSSTALDRQSPKKFDTKKSIHALPRTTRKSGVHSFKFTCLHVQPSPFMRIHVLENSFTRFHAPCAITRA